MTAPVIPITHSVAAQRAWEAYRAILLRHRDEPDKWDDSDRIRERAEAHREFLDIFEKAA